MCGSRIGRPLSQHLGAEDGGALPEVAGIVVVVVLPPLDGGPVPGLVWALKGEVLRAPGGIVVVAVTAMPAGGDEGAEEF